MKFILLPAAPLPKTETVKRRPRNMAEMKQAFLNANNKRSWAKDEAYPESRGHRTGTLFASWREVKLALWHQQRKLKKNERRRWLESIPARLTFDGPHRLDTFEQAIIHELNYGNLNPGELVVLYLESLRHAGDEAWLAKMHECQYSRSTGHVVHNDDNRWDRGDKPRVFVQLMSK